MVVVVKVAEVRPFGVIVELKSGFRGTIHYTEMNGSLSVGDELEARILRVEADEWRIGLSAKRV